MTQARPSSPWDEHLLPTLIMTLKYPKLAMRAVMTLSLTLMPQMNHVHPLVVGRAGWAVMAAMMEGTVVMMPMIPPMPITINLMPRDRLIISQPAGPLPRWGCLPDPFMTFFSRSSQ